MNHTTSDVAAMESELTERLEALHEALLVGACFAAGFDKIRCPGPGEQLQSLADWAAPLIERLEALTLSPRHTIILADCRRYLNSLQKTLRESGVLL